MSKLKKDKDGFSVFAEGSRADFTYSPLVKQLRDVMHFPNNRKEELPLLIKIISNYEQTRA